jgi:hypothetical protein
VAAREASQQEEHLRAALGSSSRATDPGICSGAVGLSSASTAIRQVQLLHYIYSMHSIAVATVVHATAMRSQVQYTGMQKFGTRNE